VAVQVPESLPPPLPPQIQEIELPAAGKLLLGLKLIGVPVSQKLSLPKVVSV
jgi:hypothetical protein